MTSAPALDMLPLAESASGPYVYDADGRQYLDGSSGVLNVNVGHAHPDVLAAIRDQLGRLTFVHRSQFRTDQARRLTERLLPIGPADTVAVEYSNSGSEANECALRLAFAYQHRRGQARRTAILSEEPSYHGMTAGALAITGMPAKRDPSVEPLLRTSTRVRPGPGRRRATHAEWSAALRAAGPENVAAIVIEPLGGASSGASPIDTETLRWLRRETRERGIVLIADEVMSGFGRTGRWWACDHADIAPDILTSGKGITGGYTSLAVTFASRTITEGLAEPLGPVVLGHTMSANPLACATANAVLTVIESGDLLANAAAMGSLLSDRLSELCDRHSDLLSDQTGLGLMRAVHLQSKHGPALAKRIVTQARAQGLILCPSGIGPTTASVLVAPPLISTPPLIDDLITRLDYTLTTVNADG